LSRICAMVLIGMGVEPKLTDSEMTTSSNPLKSSNTRGAGNICQPFAGRRSIFVLLVAIFIMLSLV
jgi:hypothetical protein